MESRGIAWNHAGIARDTSYVESGDVQEQILRAAEAGTFDVLVLGTHSRAGRSRSLAKSVAESVVRTASCRVITVRALPKVAVASAVA